jgi:tetratricopeptide (TPR) repeat protein
MGRCDEAIETLDQILARQCDDVYALAAKGHALLGLQKYTESLLYFDGALAKNPALQEVQVFKGMALYFLGRSDEAMEIEAFRTEFLARFKDEIERRKQDPKADGSGLDA